MFYFLQDLIFICPEQKNKLLLTGVDTLINAVSNQEMAMLVEIQQVSAD